MFPVYRAVEGFWERGRPARTRPGTASAFSRTWIDPTAPWLSFDPAVAIPADVVAACKVALMLSNPHKEQGCGRDARAPRNCRITPPLRRVAEAEPEGEG